MVNRSLWQALLCLFTLLFLAGCGLAGSPGVDLVVSSRRSADTIDLTRFSLGQGGLSPKPTFDPHIDQLALLRPQTLRLFLQEYFDLYPDHGRYQFETLDRAVESVLATGAKPILCLCFKPRVLYPQINQEVVHPTDYREWDELVYRLVKHLNETRRYGVEYWEVGNEPDIGEDGGCPYRFQPEDYLSYYTHTAEAIVRADPRAKVGGPALAGYRSRIGDALLDHCAAGKAPLHFFSWHLYDNDPQRFRSSIREVKGKLARHPSLQHVETVLDEWNMSLENPVLNPRFQPAFILETTRAFLEEGLSRSAYYHIRDSFVDPVVFSRFMSPAGTAFMAHWWNVLPQYDGLYDNQGRVRPAYYAFQLLGLLRGEELKVEGTNDQVRALATKNEGWMQLVFWSFGEGLAEGGIDITVKFLPLREGKFRLIRLDAESPVNNLEVQRQGNLADLEREPLHARLHRHEVFWVEVRTTP